MQTLDEATLGRLLAAQLPDALIFADTEGRIQVWSAGAEAVFGYTAGEAVGQSLDLVVPERFREAHWSGFRQAIQRGDTKYRGQLLPTRSSRKDGTTIYLEFSMAIIKDAGGEVLGVLATGRDITERRTQERQLRERLAELEEFAKNAKRE